MRWAIVQDGVSRRWFRCRIFSVRHDNKVTLPRSLLLSANVVIVDGWVSKNRYGPNGDQVDVDITPEHLPEATPTDDTDFRTEWILDQVEETPAMVLSRHDAFMFSSRKVMR